MKKILLSLLFIFQILILNAQDTSNGKWSIGAYYLPSLSFRENSKLTKKANYFKPDNEYAEYNTNFQLSFTRNIFKNLFFIQINFGVENMGFKSQKFNFKIMNGKYYIETDGFFDISRKYFSNDFLINLYLFKKIFYTGIGFSHLYGLEDEFKKEYKSLYYYTKYIEIDNSPRNNYSILFRIGNKMQINQLYYFNIGFHLRFNLGISENNYFSTQYLYNTGLFVGIGGYLFDKKY